ncbi:MAG: serine hydrolase [Candidatus Omnitrophota bacterium]|jgi:beta-lactamase class A
MHKSAKDGDMDKTKISIKIKVLAALCLLLLVFLAGLFTGVNYHKLNNGRRNLLETMRIKGYKFTSPLLDYEAGPEIKDKVLVFLKYKIEKLIESRTRNDDAIYVSVYFRDMFNGPWFGINEKENFAPASLLKVPLMIAYLKYAEQDPGILKSRLVYEKEFKNDVVQNIIPAEKLELGGSYSVEELIERMIKHSDNSAMYLLLGNISADVINKVYSDIGIIVPSVRGKSDFITVKGYSSFFRILFNASYLNREMSEKALEILSKSTFKSGLAAGVPDDVVIAHKFAERGDLVTQTFQLHDCGIVYHRKRPYLLCIMTYGKDFRPLSKIIRDISSLVYEDIDSHYNK